MKRVLSTLIAAGAALFATATAGTVYSYEIANTRQRADVGQIEYMSVSYDTDEKLSATFKLGASPSGEVATGGWFVFSPGANPKDSGNELAIFYTNFKTGELYVYKYDGRAGSATGGADSYLRRGAYITTYWNVVDVTGDVNGLTIEINDLDISALAPGALGSNWTGTSFGEKFGAWVHFTALDDFYARRGRLKKFDAGLQSWLDIADKDTKYDVSEPLGFAAAGLFLAGGLVTWRRRQRRAA